MSKRPFNIKTPLSLVALLLALFMLFTAAACEGLFDDYDLPDDHQRTEGPTGSPGVQNPGGGHSPGTPIASTSAGLNIIDSRINAIEINQSLSWGFDTSTGGYFLMDHFVAGKETAVFVSFLEPLSGIIGNQSLCYVSVYRDGVLLIDLPLVDQADGHTLYFQPRNMADVGHWGEGEYVLEFYLDGTLAASRTTQFHRASNMRILAVPILTNYGGRTRRPGEAWKTAAEMVYATTPVAKADIEYILGPELDLSARKYDITTDSGMYEVWRALCDLQTRNQDYTIIVGFIPDPIDVGDGYILGYTIELPAVIVAENNREMMVTLIHEIGHVYGVGDEYEGGSLNLPINGAPYMMSGRDFHTSRTVTSQNQLIRDGFSFGANGTGSFIYQEQRPFYVEGRAALWNVSSFMGGGTGTDPFEKWVTSDIWIQLFQSFTGVNRGVPTSGGIPTGGVSPGGGGIPTVGGSDACDYYNDSCSGQCLYCFGYIPDDADYYAECYYCCALTYVSNPSASSFTCGDCGENDELSICNLYIECPLCYGDIPLFSFYGMSQRNQSNQVVAQIFAQSGGEVDFPDVFVVEITGFIDGDGSFFADPWYTYDTDPANINARRSGEYSVRFYGGSGNLLADAFFDVDFNSQIVTSEGIASVPRGRAAVDLITRFPIETTHIEILKGDDVIHTTDVSRTAPTVSFTGLTDYQRLTDTVTLNWTASGERDELFFEIWYCPSEGEFYNIATNITGRSITIDLSDYPGTNEGYFYIYATDGVRTGEDASPWVTVPFKAPEFIGDPQVVLEAKITEEIVFDIDIYDLQDGWLWWEDEVVWTLRGTEFMTGSVLWIWPYELPPGTHVFTCTATNSEGMTAQRQITVRILDDESDLPNDWSRDDIVEALSSGFTLPLSRIDAQVTRGQYARLMATLYGHISLEDYPFPDYEEGLVTDCGQDDYDQFFMVWRGVMEAPNGRFEPNRPISEREAAVIMYQILALADPDWFYYEDDADEILEYLLDWYVVDDSGPNLYGDSVFLTNRLALVRLGRLMFALFDE